MTFNSKTKSGKEKKKIPRIFWKTVTFEQINHYALIFKVLQIVEDASILAFFCFVSCFCLFCFIIFIFALLTTELTTRTLEWKT